MLTEKDYCDYETCVALKELGFREKCLTYYDTEDNVGLLYNTQWPIDNIPYQFIDCLESHNSNTSDDNSYIDAPTMGEAQKWLREEKNIVVRIIPLYEEGKAIKGMSYTNEVIHWGDGYVAEECIEEYDSYEEALAEGVREAVKRLKEKEDE